MNIKKLLFGIATFLPGGTTLRQKGTGGTDSARYCYSVWLRHLVMARNNGLDTHPQIVAELGPGDSLGIGLSALISGSSRYLAFDIVAHADVDRNLVIFDELVTLFRNHAPIPGDDEWPKVSPRLDDYSFPYSILDHDRLQVALADGRIEKIRDSIRNPDHVDSMIKYKVPWYDARILDSASVDMIYSQAVLEHVDDLENTYNAMYRWLRPGGYASHTIDFKSHGTADEWNGHWTYSDLVWKILRGRQAYLINRQPHSVHIKLLADTGFKLICDKTATSESNLSTSQLARRFRFMSPEELATSETFVQCTKPH